MTPEAIDDLIEDIIADETKHSPFCPTRIAAEKGRLSTVCECAHLAIAGDTSTWEGY